MSQGCYDSCGVRINAVGPGEAATAVYSLPRDRGHAVHLCNAYVLSLASRDRQYATLLNDGSLNFADGTPVAWIGRLRGHQQMRGPVRGKSLMLDVMRLGVSDGATHYLYGSRPEVIARLSAALRAAVPGVRIAGAESPPFRNLSVVEYRNLVERLHDLRPTFVWVGTGTPRQDVLVARLAADVQTVLLPVGAAFDFAAGLAGEAPPWLQGSGLEWAYRLAREPRRLWRRYLLGNPTFVLHALQRRAVQ